MIPRITAEGPLMKHAINTKEYRNPAFLPNGQVWPKISIVTPSYNQGRFLEDMIVSVINQGYPNVEHIIVDGISSDETQKVIEYYKWHFSQVICEPDQGQSDAINKGFKLATGEIFTWLNCDDQLAPGALYAIALAFYYSGADMVAGACRVFDGWREAMLHLTGCKDGPLPINELLDIENCWLAGQFFFQPEVMFTRKIWEKAGGYVNEKLYYCMDYELWVRLAACGARLHVIGSPIAHLLLHEQQKTAGEAFRPEFEQIVAELRRKYLPDEPIPKKTGAGKRKLKIVFLNDCGFSYGAGRAHERLARACALAGHNITLLAFTNGDGTPENPELIAQVSRELAALKPDLVVVGSFRNTPFVVKLLEVVVNRFTSVFIMHDKLLKTGYCQPFSQIKNQIADIKFAIDTEIFAPIDKVKAREQLGLSQDKFILLTYCSHGLSEQRKDFQHLEKALQLLSDKENFVERTLIIGIGNDFNTKVIPNMITTGCLTDIKKLSVYFAAADVFVSPSQEEALGQIFIETAACGTPTIGYAVEGGCETVCDGVSGILVDEKDPVLLAEKIYEFFVNCKQRDLLSRTAPIYVSNQHSFLASYQSFFIALKETGLAPQLGLTGAACFEAFGAYKMDIKYIDMNSAMVTNDLWESEFLKGVTFADWLAQLFHWQSYSSSFPSSEMKQQIISNVPNKKLIIFGAGSSYKSNLILKKMGICPLLIIDNDEKKINQEIDGIKICSPKTLFSFNREDIFIFVSSMYYKDIKQQLETMGFAEFIHFINVG